MATRSIPRLSILVLSSEDGEQWTHGPSIQRPLARYTRPAFPRVSGQVVRLHGHLVLRRRATGESRYEPASGVRGLQRGRSGLDGPIMLEGTYGHYIWRAATDGEQAYLCGRRKRDFAETASRAQRDPLVQSAMLDSEDGLIWRRRGCFQEDYGDETAFLFEPDRSILAVARSGVGARPRSAARHRPTPIGRVPTWTATSADRYWPSGMAAISSAGGRRSADRRARRCAGWSTINCGNSRNCPAAATTRTPGSFNAARRPPWSRTTRATSGTTRGKRSPRSTWPIWNSKTNNGSPGSAGRGDSASVSGGQPVSGMNVGITIPMGGVQGPRIWAKCNSQFTAPHSYMMRTSQSLCEGISHTGCRPRC